MERAAGRDGAGEQRRGAGGLLAGPVSEDPASGSPGPQAAGPDIAADLEFLGHHWGEAYLFGHGAGGYAADRRDGRGRTLTAPDRDGMLREIEADYAACPVPRDLP